ncbi:hypothetical protein ACEQPO_10155 [Bacillus sp. SL00103]
MLKVYTQLGMSPAAISWPWRGDGREAVAVSNICGVPEKMNADIMPRCIYTLPEVASVGLTEKEAKAKGLSVQTERFDLAASGKALAAGVQSGFIKLVYDTTYG